MDSLQTEHKHMPRKKKKWIVLGIIALIFTIAAVNISVLQSKHNASTNEIQFATAALKKLNNTKLVAGQVVPGKTEIFYPDASKGQVKKLYVKEGENVTKGQKLFSYDSPDLSNQLQQLEIDKKSASIQLNQGNQKIAALQKKIQAAKNAKTAQDAINALESQLQDLQFQQQTTQLTIEKNRLQEEALHNKLNDLVVYSGINGVVQKASMDEGQSSALSAVQTNPIVQIASKDPFVIQGTLTELQRSQIQPNQPITVSANAVSNKTWKGKMTEISTYPAASELGQSTANAGGQQTPNISYYNFKAVLDSQDGLSPGYHVSIQVNLSTKKILVIPSNSIVESGNSKYVFAVKNNKLHKRIITTGIGDGNSTEVLQGLTSGDKVVKNPSSNVYDGMDVKTK